MKQKILILLIFISHCSLAQTNNDSTAITQVLKNAYIALGNYDIQSYLENCAEDYLLVENGKHIWTLEEEIASFRKNQHRKKTRTDKFQIHSLKIENGLAFAVYDLWSEIKMGDESRSLHWVESSVFRKVGEKWKVVLIHSTKIDD